MILFLPSPYLVDHQGTFIIVKQSLTTTATYPEVVFKNTPMETVSFSDPKGFMFEVIQWITPVVLFFLAYVINSWIQGSKRKKEKSLVKELLIHQVSLLKEQILSQEKRNSKCIKQIEDFGQTDLRLAKEPVDYIKKIRSIPFKDQFEILLRDRLKRNKRRLRAHNDNVKKHFNDFQRSIDALETCLNVLYENNLTGIRDINSTMELWNLSHIQTINFKNSLIPSVTNDQDEFYIGFATVIHVFEEKNGKEVQDVSLGYGELVEPLIEHCKSHPRDPRARMLLAFLLESRKAFLQVTATRQNMKEDIDNLTEIIKGEREKLNSLLEFYV